ncbi:MAG: sulfotransferase [Sphingobacteriales bacterium]|nr:sulfotransferase [Sphingobacteriales bacterium]
MSLPNSTTNIPLHFLIGIGRSGTTLLTTMLNAHPNLVATPENDFALFFQSQFADKDMSKPADIDLFVRLFNRPRQQAISVWNPEPTTLRRIFARHPQGISYADLCKEVYLSYSFKAEGSNDIRAIIDKNPIYTLHIPLWTRLFLDAKFIVLVRDYRDNILSRKRTDKRSRLNATTIHAAVWNIYYRHILKAQQQNPQRFLTIRYEDLAANAEAVLRQICSFLAIGFEPVMLEAYRQNELLKSKRVKESISQADYEHISAMHENLSRPVNTDRVAAWQREMPIADRATAEQICGQLGERFGYATTLDISWFQKMRIFAKQLVLGTYAHFYTEVWAKRVFYLPLKWRLFFASFTQQ